MKLANIIKATARGWNFQVARKFNKLQKKTIKVSKSETRDKWTFKKNKTVRSSSQDGGVGRNVLLPCTMKRRITTNLKTKKQPELPEN